MSQPGEMPRPGAEPALADRWIAEVAAHRQGGPTRRYRARARLTVTSAELAWARAHPHQRVGDMVLEAIFGRWVPDERPQPPLPPPMWVAAEVGLYPIDAEPGSLPDAIGSFAADGLDASLEAQRGEVDVRGTVAPGRGLALVLDDGTIVTATQPAHPPPAIRAGIWRLSDEVTVPRRRRWT